MAPQFSVSLTQFWFFLVCCVRCTYEFSSLRISVATMSDSETHGSTPASSASPTSTSGGTTTTPLGGLQALVNALIDPIRRTVRSELSAALADAASSSPSTETPPTSTSVLSGNPSLVQTTHRTMHAPYNCSTLNPSHSNFWLHLPSHSLSPSPSFSLPLSLSLSLAFPLSPLFSSSLPSSFSSLLCDSLCSALGRQTPANTPLALGQQPLAISVSYAGAAVPSKHSLALGQQTLAIPVSCTGAAVPSNSQ